MVKIFFVLAALYGFLAVALGAFGAHALKSRVEPPMLDVWQTAVQYQMFHVVALFVVAFWLRGSEGNLLVIAGWSFAIGTLLFSGSLYALVLSGVKILGAVTPIGGLILLLAWVCLLVNALKA